MYDKKYVRFLEICIHLEHQYSLCMYARLYVCQCPEGAESSAVVYGLLLRWDVSYNMNLCYDE